MKKLLTILIMLFTISSISQEQINFAGMTFGQDKLYHAGAGASIAITMMASDKYLFKRKSNPIYPTIAAGATAIFWEYGNVMMFGNKRFSGKDVLWTTGSAIIVNAIGRVVFKPQNKKHWTTWRIFKNRNKPVDIEDYNPELVKSN